MKHTIYLYAGITILFCALIVQNISAAPMFNVPQKLTQPDGTMLHCFASGDEFQHVVHNKEGFIINQNEAGYYYFTDKKIQDEHTNINSKQATKTNDAFLSIDDKPNKGTLTNLVVFVRFADDVEYDTTIAYYDSLFNSNAGASLTNYYQAASYGKLSIKSYFYPAPINKQVRSYKLQHKRGYYTEFSKANNSIGYKNDEEAQAREVDMIKEILQYLSTIVPANIKLDVNVENYLDNVTIVLKGNSDGWGKILWPHHSTTKSGTTGFLQQIQNVEVYDYIVLMSDMIDVGVVCHEFFHSLDAPDLYRTNNLHNIFPLYHWDLMENQYAIPQFMSAYMKYKYGKWIDKMPTITYPGEYSLNPLTMPDTNCYAINISNSNEYLMLEYRKPVGLYESSLKNIIMQYEPNKASTFDGGLLIYRINNKRAGQGNSDANEATPDEVYCYRPNSTKIANGEPWNSAFNAKYLRNVFSSNTNPATVLFNSDTARLTVNNIYEDENKLYFTYHNDSITFIKWPNNGNLNANKHLVVIWDQLKIPCAYHVQIANNINFTAASLEINKVIYNDSVFYSNVLLSPDRCYYARVGAVSPKSGRIMWSRTIYFCTKNTMEICGYYGAMCAGDSFKLQYETFDATLGNMEYDILISDKNGNWNEPVLLGITNLQQGLNSINVYLPDNLITGYRYQIKLQNKRNNNLFAISNNIVIYGLPKAKIYVDSNIHADNNNFKCKNTTSVIHFEPDISAVKDVYCSYQWTSKNCEIIATDNLYNSATVKWNRAGNAEVVLTTTNPKGCTKTYTQNVIVSDIPRINIAAKSYVCAQTPAIYYLPNEKNTTTEIQVEGGTYQQNHSDYINIVWDRVPMGYIKITRTMNNGCFNSITVRQPVNYIPNMIIAGQNDIYCIYPEKYNIALANNNPVDTNRYSFLWKTSKGQILSATTSTTCELYITKDDMQQKLNDTLILEVAVTDKNTLCTTVFSKPIVMLDSFTTISANENMNNNCNVVINSDDIVIDVYNADWFRNVKIELYNLLGNPITILKVPFGRSQSTNQFNIKTQDIPTGAYFLRIYTGNELMYNNVIIINK